MVHAVPDDTSVLQVIEEFVSCCQPANASCHQDVSLKSATATLKALVVHAMTHLTTALQVIEECMSLAGGQLMLEADTEISACNLPRQL